MGLGGDIFDRIQRLSARIRNSPEEFDSDLFSFTVEDPQPGEDELAILPPSNPAEGLIRFFDAMSEVHRTAYGAIEEEDRTSKLQRVLTETFLATDRRRQLLVLDELSELPRTIRTKAERYGLTPMHLDHLDEVERRLLEAHIELLAPAAEPEPEQSYPDYETLVLKQKPLDAQADSSEPPPVEISEVARYSLGVLSGTFDQINGARGEGLEAEIRHLEKLLDELDAEIATSTLPASVLAVLRECSRRLRDALEQALIRGTDPLLDVNQWTIGYWISNQTELAEVTTEDNAIGKLAEIVGFIDSAFSLTERAWKIGAGTYIVAEIAQNTGLT